MTVVDAVDMFARRTAEACLFLWDRTTIHERMQQFPDEFEGRVVKQIEAIQRELLQGDK